MYRKIAITFLMVAVLVVAGISPAAADDSGPVEPLTPAPSAETGEITDETPSLWFVEMSGAPIAEGNSKFSVDSEHQRFRDNAKKERIEYKEHFSYDSLWNGFSVSATTAELGKLSRIEGVVAIYPVMVVKIPQTTPSSLDPALYSALSLTGADAAQSELGYTGAGVKVAVMDTGIDYNHPDLGGCFGPGCRVFKGYDFVGDAYNADDTSPGYNPVPSPDPDPDDCNGHGTHVSGIIGANGVVTGVAPDVKFGAYRVFGCDGSTTDDIMLAAMERAYKDGMDVLNMSIGSAYEWPQSPTAVASSRLVKKGMVVVASIGNNGANGLYSAGAPGLGENVIGVASFDNTNVFLPYFEVNGAQVGYVTMEFSPAAPTSGGGEIVDAGLACSPLAIDLTGKIALAARGTCAFAVKATNAINAGAVAVLISNNAAGVFNGTLGAPLDGVTPVVGISLADGNFIRAQAAPIMMTWTDQQASFISPTGGLISSFSSFGLSPDLALKPDIGAPGGNIYSTYPLELGGYANLSGTSMSSPHVAGAAALYLQAHHRVRASDMRAILQNSAEPADWWGFPGAGYLDNVHRQGAGMLQIDDAIEATTFIEPGKLSLGESQQGPVTREIKVRNISNSTITYTLSYESGLATSGVITPGYWDSYATVTFNTDSITLKKNQEKKVRVTITAPNEPAQGQYGGWIVLTPSDGGHVYRVPFAGFVGDYQSSIEVLANPYGLPWLVDVNWNDPVAPFTLVDANNMPYVVVHLDHQSRTFRLEAFDAVTGKSVGTIIQLDYMIRNSTSSGVFEFAWDGTTTVKHNKVFTAPDGQYFIKLSVLKALGNSKNSADWETWTSPVFEIDRP